MAFCGYFDIDLEMPVLSIFGKILYTPLIIFSIKFSYIQKNLQVMSSN